MLGRIRSQLTYANVVSTACLFVVLGGTAYATLTVTGKNVKNGSLTTKDIKDFSLLKRDFARSQLPRGPAGPQGAAGERGADGATGPPGQNGEPGPVASAIGWHAAAGDPTAFTRLLDRDGLTLEANCTTAGGYTSATIRVTSTVPGAHVAAAFTHYNSGMSSGPAPDQVEGTVDTTSLSLLNNSAQAGTKSTDQGQLLYHAGNKTDTLVFLHVADDSAQRCVFDATLVSAG